jgi:Asp-tRNA(Asn)/Glu-tRNA(Gln) amidotransferase A subunit family amidase
MGADGDPADLTVAEAARRIASSALTSEQLVRACLSRIEAREPDVMAWTFLDPERALSEARARDQGPIRGRLHGIPLGVKDIFDTVDMPTAYGSTLYSGNRPGRDAAAVALARSEGAVILGKTVTTEFAYFAPGPTRHPLYPSRTPGGSSSGSAAAVADGMVPAALGTQTAGSIIRPAAYCGIVGFKPSYGRISRSGVLPCAESLDTVGTLARTVEDAALVAAVSGGWDLGLPSEVTNQPPTVGLYRSGQWDRAAPESQAAVEAATGRWREAGARVDDVPELGAFTVLVDAHAVVMAFEASRAFAHEYRVHRDALSSQLVSLIEVGLGMSHHDRNEALLARDAGRVEFDRLFRDVDVLVTPAATGEAPPGLGSTGDPLFNRAWTLLGVPVIHLPGFTGPSGLPVGVQMVGALDSDDALLWVARWAEPALAAD